MEAWGNLGIPKSEARNIAVRVQHSLHADLLGEPQLRCKGREGAKWGGECRLSHLKCFNTQKLLSITHTIRKNCTPDLLR